MIKGESAGEKTYFVRDDNIFCPIIDTCDVADKLEGVIKRGIESQGIWHEDVTILLNAYSKLLRLEEETDGEDEEKVYTESQR